MYVGRHYLRSHHCLAMQKAYTSKKNNITCAICNKAFGLKEALTEHMITHKDDAVNTCSVCGKSYKHRQSLHRPTTESSTSRPVEKKTCQNCNKVGWLYWGLTPL